MHVGEFLILFVESPDFLFVEFFDSHESIFLFFDFDQFFLEHLYLFGEDFVFLDNQFRVILKLFVMVVSVGFLFVQLK